MSSSRGFDIDAFMPGQRKFAAALGIGQDAEVSRYQSPKASHTRPSGLWLPHDPDPDRPRAKISATPYIWRDPASIPARQWLYGVHLIRQFMSVTFAPGGLGKSSLVIVEALALASGRPLLGQKVHERCNVWLWNGEDPLDELHRRVAAACQLFHVMPEEIEGRLFLDSGRDSQLVVVTKVRDEIVVAEPVVQAVIETVRANKIDVIVVDPFVLTHSVPENDNGAIDRAARQWGRVADACNCAVSLVHHVRKGQSGQAEYTVEDGRGAVALLAAARSARVLNRMTKEEGESAGVDNHRNYFRVDNGKANLAPPADKTTWAKIESVKLANGDNVGVVTPWVWPSALNGVTADDILTVQLAINGKKLRADSQASNWVGNAIAEVLGLHPAKDKAKLKGIIKAWLQSGMLKVVKVTDSRKHERPVIEVGEWANS